ncbi:MAG: cell division protein FtsA [Proteobacteria bacterium]|nr:cell division protein FtsA [Pseudomonadota bacterium]
MPNPKTSSSPKTTTKKHPDIFALDLGTTKFCLATLRYTQKQLRPIMDKVVVPSGGMKKGMLSHMLEARTALEQLITLAEQQFQQEIKRVYVGVAGSHLKGKIAHATLDLGGDTISEEDQNTLLNQCAGNNDPSYEMLHNIPLTYQVDAREIVDCAVGFSGDFLKAESFLVKANKNYLKDLIRLCNVCGLTVVKLYAEPYASAMVTVPYEQKQQGVVVADIGGGTTDGIVFKGGKPVRLFTVNVGGELMSRDLATCLRISMKDAEDIKLHFGLSSPDNHLANKTRTLKRITGEDITITAADVYPILAARIEELYHIILSEIGPLKTLLSSGMIITGGGSELKHISPFLQRPHTLFVNKNQPTLPKLANGTSTPNDRITASTPYATVAGLLYLAWLNEENNPKAATLSRASHHFKTLLGWIKDMTR